MQRSTVVILMVLAFFLGALGDRIYNWSLAYNGVPTTTTASLASTPDTYAEQPGGFTLNACLASAQRRGMTHEEGVRACREIMN